MNGSKCWQLREDLHFLNHGSFGATPISVLQRQRALQDELEADPIRFLAPERELEPKLDEVRARIARLVNTRPEHLAFVRNATEGVNAVVQSVPLTAGDEVVVTNHGYNACTNALRYRAAAVGAVVKMAQFPFPVTHADQVVEGVRQAFSSRTRLLLIDHVTSPTGLVLPIEQLVRLAHEHQVRVLVDGAHAPGMVAVDLQHLDADYYTANHHKWLCAPKASGFLYVKPQWQPDVFPPVISHAYNRPRPGRSRFLAQFDWCGTYDPTPLLCLPAAIDFLDSLHPDGLSGVMRSNRSLALQSQKLLAEALGVPIPVPEQMLGSLVALPIPTSALRGRAPEEFQRLLRERYGFELPVYAGTNSDSFILRISLQAYNRLEQVERLAVILKAELQLP